MKIKVAKNMDGFWLGAWLGGDDYMEIILSADPESILDETALSVVEDNKVGLELNSDTFPMVSQPIIEEHAPVMSSFDDTKDGKPPHKLVF